MSELFRTGHYDQRFRPPNNEICSPGNFDYTKPVAIYSRSA